MAAHGINRDTVQAVIVIYADSRVAATTRRRSPRPLSPKTERLIRRQARTEWQMGLGEQKRPHFQRTERRNETIKTIMQSPVRPEQTITI
jgi:hypothetical protein